MIYKSVRKSFGFKWQIIAVSDNIISFSIGMFKKSRFKIKKGTQVNIYDDGNRIIVEPLAEDPIEKGRGMLKTRGKILRALVEDRKKEAEL